MSSTLPPEVMRRIIDLLIHEHRSVVTVDRSSEISHHRWALTKDAPVYASVCKFWQDIIERESFAILFLSLERLSDANTIMSPRRRGYVQSIHLQVILPHYFDAAWGQVETPEEQLDNSVITTATIKAFIEHMAKWKMEDLPKDRRLTVRLVAMSPSDEHYAPPEEMRQRQLWPRPKWKQIYEKRYENSVLELKDIHTFASLPEVSVIDVIDKPHTSGARHFAPAVVCALFGRLRNVRAATGHVWDDPRDYSDRRHRIRADLAQVVQDFEVVPDMLILHQETDNKLHENHSAEPVIFTPQGTDDPLTVSLRGLSQRSKNLTLSMFIIGDEFWSTQSTDADNRPAWPFLTHLHMRLRLSTPDGRWRFDYAEPESQSESEGDSESEDSEDSDYEAVNSLRRRAMPDMMNNFYRSVARAALQMPQLKFMELDFRGWDSKDVTFHTFRYQVKDSGPLATWYSYPSFGPEADIMELWKQVGVKYHNVTTGIFVSEERP
ncbi:hypothetical protein PFICI_09215 [Pestalotiopsis fici W106-1]|uniref:DUF6546 domain-containing protein n=1 Tax=Pestalotiopsis fici (strain W106-1 / CGMCC3.15140) TaxID=1229662 RepID=W3X1W4_PESFW|nr:uncharacterized protein PFICI_09215 [Pestalotiopsis fici W106-1]ETS79362.1 hypothetical protein PFICI_09215 [Pestalotiopsis fici W106-1]